MATRQNLILVGGGGHCRSCIDVIETGGKFKIAGIVDIKDKTGTKVLGYKITGSDGDLPALVKKFKSVLITIGQIKSPAKRKEKYETLKKLGAKFPTVISPKTHISKYSKVGQGTIIMHAVVINANVSVGENCIINTGAILEHDAKVGHHCHISTRAVVNGECQIGDEVFIGSGAVVANNISIASGAVIGANAVVVKNITEPGLYVGNPARRKEAHVESVHHR